MQTKYDLLESLQQYHNEGNNLFLLLDGAADQRVFAAVFEHNGVNEYIPLFLQTPFTSVLQYGPTLARIKVPSPIFDWFWDVGTTLYAGIILCSPLTTKALASQLKELLTVQMPDGPKALFRFYDPRIIRKALTLTRQNSCDTLTKNISALFAPQYTFGQSPIWEQVLLKMEIKNG